jgi:hypothetical protein
MRYTCRYDVGIHVQVIVNQTINTFLSWVSVIRPETYFCCPDVKQVPSNLQMVANMLPGQGYFVLRGSVIDEHGANVELGSVE